MAESTYRVTKEVPLTWLIGSGVVVLLWAGSQYVSYSRMSDSVTAQAKLIAELTTQVTTRFDALSEKVDGGKIKNLEQDFLIANLKQRIETIEADSNRARSMGGGKP